MKASIRYYLSQYLKSKAERSIMSCLLGLSFICIQRCEFGDWDKGVVMASGLIYTTVISPQNRDASDRGGYRSCKLSERDMSVIFWLHYGHFSDVNLILLLAAILLYRHGLSMGLFFPFFFPSKAVSRRRRKAHGGAAGIHCH